jgi:hypothetical protein
MLQATYMEIYRPVLYKQTTDISLFNFKVIYIYAIWFLVSVSQIPPEQHNLREKCMFPSPKKQSHHQQQSFNSF